MSFAVGEGKGFVRRVFLWIEAQFSRLSIQLIQTFNSALIAAKGNRPDNVPVVRQKEARPAKDVLLQEEIALIDEAKKVLRDMGKPAGNNDVKIDIKQVPKPPPQQPRVQPKSGVLKDVV